MKRIYTYDVHRHMKGNELRRIRSYRNLDGYLVWDGIGMWWYSDKDIEAITTYKEDENNGVFVKFIYLDAQ